MTRTHLLLAALAVAACRGEPPTTRDPAAPEAQPAPAPPDAAPPPAPTPETPPPAPAAALDPRCTAPCRFLADVALDEVAAEHQRACAAPWPAAAPTDCEQIDHQRNCIYATGGYTFQRAKWRDVFSREAWYRPRADFKETDLSRVAAHNIRALKEQALACRSTGATGLPAKFTASKIRRADLATIVDWFARRARGETVLPARLEVDGRSATAAEIREWLGQEHLFVLKSWTPIEYARFTRAGGSRAITASTGQPPPTCNSGDEDCEGFEWITFELDGEGAIVGLSVGAAACPLVYVERPDGGLAYEGEILRNLPAASYEATQRLRLDAARCAGEVRVQLVEAKDEVTYLDAIALEVDGVAVPPRSCTHASPPAYCRDDGEHATLARGEVLALVFDVPPGAACGRPVLRANGHYVPVREPPPN